MEVRIAELHRMLAEPAAMTAQIAAGHPDALCGCYRGWFNTMFTEARRATGRDESLSLEVVQDDSELLKMRAEIGRPAGLVLSGSRVWLTNAVTDAALGLPEPPGRKPPA